LAAAVAFSLAACGPLSPPENRLVNAARSDDLSAMRKILANNSVGLDKVERGMLGYTPLIASVLSDGTNVFNFLLASGANVNATSRDGETPLMVAITKGDINYSKVVALIQARADVNARDKQGVSVLQYAKAAGAPNLLQILKAHGARD